jgi:hypothetical protein
MTRGTKLEGQTMSEEHMESTARSIAMVQIRYLRTRILILLDSIYPERMDEITISHCDGNKPGVKMIQRELHYLAEKTLIDIETTQDKRLNAALTAKGRDFLTGDIKEVGLIPASDLSYCGPSNAR